MKINFFFIHNLKEYYRGFKFNIKRNQGLLSSNKNKKKILIKQEKDKDKLRIEELQNKRKLKDETNEKKIDFILFFINNINLII